MKTALATDEPDEPERKQALTLVASTLNYAAGAAGTGIVRYITWPAHGGNADAGLAPKPRPWQCPDCKTWMAPTVTEHRCA